MLVMQRIDWIFSSINAIHCCTPYGVISPLTLSVAGFKYYQVEIKQLECQSSYANIYGATL